MGDGSLHGSLYGDKGYISEALREKLHKQGGTSTKFARAWTPCEVSVSDAVLLKKRMLR